METTCVIQKTQKKQKLSEKEDISGNIKGLGSLPEEVLRHILSFLPTKDAVRTSVLSKSLPVLEELKLDDCSWGDLKFVTISAPKLNSLSIFKMGVQDGDIQRSGDLCLVMIVGDSLKEFYYKGLMFAEYCLYNSFRVEKAEIVTKSKYDRPTNIGRFLWNLLIGLSSVELLRLSSDMVKVLSDSPEFLPHMPMFNNLIDLIIVDYRVDLDCTVLLKILQKSPCLQTLNFSEGISLSLNRKEDDMILDPVPLCFLSHLKCINIGSYFGHEKELLAVKILLKNAVVLDKINITCPASYDKNFDRQVKVLTQLLELPRRSQNCKIRALTV
ncbi:F-box/LRR-repeat protein At2g42720-like isoform X2 [Corylus avellana]|uniref:F-box/LRR-repeat protein At2g42720-like isoform X2 n=1 Tax=Corylus avellana TaxID=13451 RepID=UPI00286AD3B2|nr:F-box/LRR-repeat protein At2g42720-like isoform X2 [Corylus avellana]